MRVGVQEDVKYLAGAVGIHLLVALLLVGFSWRSHQAIVPQLAIKGVIVSESALNAMVTSVEPTAPIVEPEETQEKQTQQDEQMLKQQQEARLEEQKRLAAEAEKKQQRLKEQLLLN